MTAALYMAAIGADGDWDLLRLQGGERESSPKFYSDLAPTATRRMR